MIIDFSDTENSSANTIFVVDDDDAVRDSISALLEINDRDVRAFESAQHFLEHYQGNAYCLLVDFQMPYMNGLELVTHLADQSQLPPTVLLTAHSDEHTAKEVLSLGVHRILIKPASEDALLHAIDGAAAAVRGNPL